MSAQSKSLPARLARTGAIALATWIALAAVWMLLVDNESLPELLVGAGAVSIGTVGSELVRAQRIAQIRIRPGWLLRAWKPIARVPVDVCIVMWALARQLTQRKLQRGSLRALRFRAYEEDPGSNARRALAELAGSTAPNTIVIGIDRRRRLILAHQLVPTDDAKPSLDALELG